MGHGNESRCQTGDGKCLLLCVVGTDKHIAWKERFGEFDFAFLIDFITALLRQVVVDSVAAGLVGQFFFSSGLGAGNDPLSVVTAYLQFSKQLFNDHGIVGRHQ